MKRRSLIRQSAVSMLALVLARRANAARLLEGLARKSVIKDPLDPGKDRPDVSKGPFEPSWESLQKYKTPDWYRDAKFGLWAHWGPQCQPEAGDWYARGMYEEGSRQYKYHLEKYGHPSVVGFKDVIREWKADKWDPEELVALYKKTGAQYFVAMASHHDNFDLFDSRYQPKWNATQIGPRKDLIAGWAKAARRQQLPFGVSIHASHAWSWYEPSQGADKAGPYAGVPYDGRTEPELYAQDHPLSNGSSVHLEWNWGNGVTPPSSAYMEKFFHRTIDLIDQYNPDLLYFDDSQLPFWPVSEVGLRIAAYHYNKSIKDHGELRAVINGKILDEDQRKAMVWDIERGRSNSIEPLPWQTDTCIGGWHYDRGIYDRKGYKTAQTVVHTLIDIVSKNGNLLLNIPVRGDGTIDELERKVVEEIGVWMNANSESIYGTRPWKVFGEGPAQEGAAILTAQGFNEGKLKPFSAQDIRFAAKGNVLYATVMGWPGERKITIKSLASGSVNYPGEISGVELLSTKQALAFDRTANGLEISFPEERPAAYYANALKIV